jgi:hypothetical protein
MQSRLFVETVLDAEGHSISAADAHDRTQVAGGDAMRRYRAFRHEPVPGPLEGERHWLAAVRLDQSWDRQSLQSQRRTLRPPRPTGGNQTGRRRCGEQKRLASCECFGI